MLQHLAVYITLARMGKRVFIAGLVLTALFPFVAAIGFGAHAFMHCSGGGSSGPVDGCQFLGMQFNFPANLATPAFVASFFAVPLGVLVSLVGLVLVAFEDWRSRPKQRSFGVYRPTGSRLTQSEATAAISTFSPEECYSLLRSFFKHTNLPEKSAEQLRKRCIETLQSSRAYEV